MKLTNKEYVYMHRWVELLSKKSYVELGWMNEVVKSINQNKITEIVSLVYEANTKIKT